MKKDIIVGGICLAFVIIIIIALFSNQSFDTSRDIVHKIKTFDGRQVGFSPPDNRPLAGFTKSMRFYPYPRGDTVPVALSGASARVQAQASLQLIKELGIEVIPISGGKLKISGVMGNSWAERGGLKRGDIILRFNKKSIKGLAHFKSLIEQATPEKDYRIKILRGSKVKSLRVTIGEGEMEGFTPIRPIAFTQPAGQGWHRSDLYQCPRCGNCI
ncbi:MAG: PDZ domain-containing protein, partial [Candidatus Omnitrophota bacterium]